MSCLKAVTVGVLALSTLSLGCDRGKATGTGAKSEATGAGKTPSPLRAPRSIVGKAELSLNLKVTLCWRPRETPYEANDAEFSCGAELNVKKAPFGVGVNGRQVFEALRSLDEPPALGKVWAKSPQPGEDPKAVASAIDLADEDNEWFGNYVCSDASGRAWMFLEIEKP